MKIAIGVITYHRPGGLRALLVSLAALEPAAEGSSPPRVVVVDNDPGESARAVCATAAHELALDVRYIVETARGIPQARNAVLEAAIDEFDAIAFVDDDEVVPPDWLATLVDAQIRHGADVVTGPMAAEFVIEPPAWVRAGRYFESPTRYPDGALRPVAASGNVLIMSEALRRTGVRFDHRFALTGGSDTHFFFRLVRAGCTIVWCDGAVATETIPASRVTRSWLLRRNYRLGTTSGLCARDLDRDRPWLLAVRAAKGIGRILHGGLVLVPWLVLPRRRAIDALRLMWFGWGVLVGLLGRQYLEYEQVHSM